MAMVYSDLAAAVRRAIGWDDTEGDDHILSALNKVLGDLSESSHGFMEGYHSETLAEDEYSITLETGEFGATRRIFIDDDSEPLPLAEPNEFNPTDTSNTGKPTGFVPYPDTIVFDHYADQSYTVHRYFTKRLTKLNGSESVAHWLNDKFDSAGDDYLIHGALEVIYSDLQEWEDAGRHGSMKRSALQRIKNMDTLHDGAFVKYRDV